MDYGLWTVDYGIVAGSHHKSQRHKFSAVFGQCCLPDVAPDAANVFLLLVFRTLISVNKSLDENENENENEDEEEDEESPVAAGICPWGHAVLIAARRRDL